MASYIANNAARDTVSIMLSNAEAHALLDLAEEAFSEGLSAMNGQRMSAARRAMAALAAATNQNARRAGFFDL